MKNTYLIVLFILIILPACNQKNADVSNPKNIDTNDIGVAFRNEDVLLEKISNIENSINDLKNECECDVSLSSDRKIILTKKGVEDSFEETVIIKIDNSDDIKVEAVGSEYKWVICKAKISRTCAPELPFFNEYSWWSTEGKSYYAKKQSDKSGPAYKCKSINLKYRYGNKTCKNTNFCHHSADKKAGCRNLTLTATFTLKDGSKSIVKVKPK